MQQFLLVGLGGFIGSVGRYLVSLLMSSLALTSHPFSTFTVNIVGSLAIGLALGYGQENLGKFYDFLVPGLLGGFTTYSAFAGESLRYFQQGSVLAAFLYIVLTIVLGIVAASLGFFLTKS